MRIWKRQSYRQNWDKQPTPLIYYLILGKHCCSISYGTFGCCDVWKPLLEEIHVAGREHSLGVPSTFGRNRTRRHCRAPICHGTCCRRFCCEHRNAECCVSNHLCCAVGHKCCGNGQWCCKFKLSCSSAYGYCLSPAFNNSPRNVNGYGYFLIMLLIFGGTLL